MAAKIIDTSFDPRAGVEHITLQDGLGRKRVISLHMNSEKCPCCGGPMATLNLPDAQKMDVAIQTQIAAMDAEEVKLRNYATARGYSGYDK